MSSRRTVVVAVVAVLVAVIAAVIYRSVVPGLSSARTEPPALEVAVATWLLRESVPEAQRSLKNPLGADAADIAAGRALFREKCEGCHAYDGSGKTEIGGGEYPRPPALRSLAVSGMSDGEVFYHI
ncbi:MAG TPA: hypothetical protein VET85_02565, partial [Stellaceae bacterium]|nr:hypothetical protein [Stellaceae bacterium]